MTAVAIAWWQPMYGAGGRSQAIRGNVTGFLEAGCDVDLYLGDDRFSDLEARADEYDLILLPFISASIETETHVHLQIGGYGPPDVDVDAFANCAGLADTVSVLDAALATYFHEAAGLDLDVARVIPNAPNTDLFPPRGHNEEQGQVFVPKVGGPYKSPDLLRQTASQTPAIGYEAIAANGSIQSPSNVRVRPALPLDSMPDRYAAASAVYNPSSQEGLPNVAFEAFLTCRVYLARPRSIALVQTVPAADLDADDFGLAATEWLESYRTSIYTGDHYVTAADALMPRVIAFLMDHPERRAAIGDAAGEWVEAFDFNWTDKAERILALADLA